MLILILSAIISSILTYIKDWKYEWKFGSGGYSKKGGSCGEIRNE